MFCYAPVRMPRKPAEFDKDDYVTPPEVLALVYAAIGIPDLDPCSNERSLVISKRKLGFHQDGLNADWDARSVFMNPPYSNTHVWVQHFISWHRGDSDKQGVMLLSAETGLVWWQELLLPRIDRWIFLPRIAFLANDKPIKGARHNSALIYKGSKGGRVGQVWPSPVWRACR